MGSQGLDIWAEGYWCPSSSELGAAEQLEGSHRIPEQASWDSKSVCRISGERGIPQTPLLEPVLCTSDRREAEDLLPSSKRHLETRMTHFKKVLQP